ncbi:MAG: glycine--tRNA ligase subunit beta, partial [Xanthomonadales bacterium]|nr:glycine--tRNA ligase subunit beta [Xanthomonadales bacterium]
MSELRTLLIEIGCEELPPKALDELAEAFAHGVCAGLEASGIDADIAAASVFRTPRRLAVRIPNVGTMAPAQSVERRGPALAAGLDAEGNPGKALLGFAKSCGVAVDQLQRMATDKGEWFVYRAMTPGKTLAELLQGIVDVAIKSMPIPRPMRWGAHEFSFVRPMHWLLALHGSEVIDLELFGIRSGRVTHGHRFHHPAPVTVAEADAWVDALRRAHVEVDSERRETLIRDRCRDIAIKQGLDLMPMATPELLRELVNITEWPVPILCRFEDDFLALPAPVLSTTMVVDQRFIATSTANDAADDNFSLSPWFFGIANIDSKDPAQIRQGYERVIRPRFADAKFFYDADLKTPLAEHQQALRDTTYQRAL